MRELLPKATMEVVDSIEEEGRETAIRRLQYHCGQEIPDWNAIDSVFSFLVFGWLDAHHTIVHDAKEARWTVR